MISGQSDCPIREEKGDRESNASRTEQRAATEMSLLFLMPTTSRRKGRIFLAFGGREHRTLLAAGATAALRPSGRGGIFRGLTEGI